MCPVQGIQLITLNVHFDQVNALAWFEIIVQRYNIDWHTWTRISFGQVRPVIDI